jgi:hypothetical protein
VCTKAAKTIDFLIPPIFLMMGPDIREIVPYTKALTPPE